MDSRGAPRRLMPIPIKSPIPVTRARQEKRIWLIRSGFLAPVFWLTKLTVA